MKNYTIHKQETRGHANHGWLNAKHSFSFGSYYNPERIHFGALRVLNDDEVAPGRGFGTHPHDNMEIVTIPLEGTLEHRDSMGNTAVIRNNEIQMMSTGTGIQHSEYNKSLTEYLRLLQIWVFPKHRDIKPRYDQMELVDAELKNNLKVVVSPLESDDGGIKLNQDAWFSLGQIEAGYKTVYSLKKEGNGAYAFVIEGSLKIDGHVLNKRDALGVWDATDFEIEVIDQSRLLIIDVPMKF
jgi:redox-sensitive bicupin YhaK (pirin superfamily)